MSDDLVISGGGSVAVATDEQFADAAALRQVASDARGLAHLLRGSRSELFDVIASIAIPPTSVRHAVADLQSAIDELVACADRADHLAAMLLIAAAYYGEVEGVRERALQELSAGAGYFLGVLSSLVVAIGAPLAPYLIAVATDQPTPVGKHLGGRLRSDPSRADEMNRLLSDPATVTLIREAAMSTDDFMSGSQLLPPTVALAMGDEGLGLIGLGSSAAVVASYGSRAGLLAETAVTTTSTTTNAISGAPHGFADRIDRLSDPLASPDHAQVVVEKYSQVGVPDRFEVYISGTVDFSPRAGADPFDLTSNIAGIAGAPAGSYVAVQQALAQSGATSSSPVVFTGYSQGGLVASLLAASGDYNAQGVVTIGAPAGQVHLPTNVPVVIIEHTDDLVPALGGTQTNHDALVVQRRAFDSADSVPRDMPVPAHHLQFYRETGALLDTASSPQVLAASAKLDAFGQGATSVTSTRYVATRVGP